MLQTENPAAHSCANRIPEIVAIAKPLDTWNPSETHPEFQSEMLAIATIMRRFRVSFWHAKTICHLSGLGGCA